LQLAHSFAAGRDVIDQLELAVRLEQPGVRPDAVHPHTIERLGRGNQHVRH
jgi:hypothetical protein